MAKSRGLFLGDPQRGDIADTGRAAREGCVDGPGAPVRVTGLTL